MCSTTVESSSTATAVDLADDVESRYRHLLDLAHDEEATVPAVRMSIWRLGWRVSQHEPRSFWSGYLLFVMFFTFPVLSGWLLGRGFNALSTGHNSRVYWIGAAWRCPRSPG